jgi:type IV secretory pathway TraG/TraD family ATPase VirD4
MVLLPIKSDISFKDIGSLSPDDVIIIVQGHNTTPIKAKALAYYNFENLKELVSFNNKNQ